MLAPLSPEAEVTETVLRIFVRAVAVDKNFGRSARRARRTTH